MSLSTKNRPRLPKVVLFFDHKEAEFAQKIKLQLQPLVDKKLLSLWVEDDLLGHVNVEEEIERHIAESAIILYLLSADYIASERGRSRLDVAIAHQVAQKGLLIPILVKSCMWRETGLSQACILPENREALTSNYWEKEGDKPYTQIADKIRQIIQEQTGNDKKTIELQDESIQSRIEQFALSFIHSPDIEVMQHSNYHEFQDLPGMAAHFKIYQKMLSELRERMLSRDYNICRDNLEDANRVLQILDRIGERLKAAEHPSTRLYLAAVDEFKDVTKSFKLEISDPENEMPGRVSIAIAKYVMPYCDEIEIFEQKFSKFAAHSILDEFPPPSQN